MTKLAIAYLRQKVCLVFDRVSSRTKVIFAIFIYYGCIMPCRRLIKPVSVSLLEKSKFDNLIAHHVRMRRQSLLHCIKRIFHNMRPILFVQRNDVKWQIVAPSYKPAHFNILFGTAIAFAVIQSYLYIEQMQLMSLLLQQMHGNRTIDTS